VPNVVSRRVTKYQRQKGILGIPLRSVKQLRLKGYGFFEVPLANVGGRDYNLDQFERTFVFDDPDSAASGTGRKAPARTLDPRAHFALVCASVGCAPLQPRAFLPESLDAQLDHATRAALAHPNQMKWDADRQHLSATMVFTWYERDFGDAAKAFEFVQRHAPEALRPAIAAKPEHRIDEFIPPDWDLNIVPLKKKPRPAASTP